MEPHILPFEMSPPEQMEPMPADHGIAPGGCFPAPYLPDHAPHTDWVLDLINEYLPWGRPIPVEADGGPA
jgi:hypothetical protein